MRKNETIYRAIILVLLFGAWNASMWGQVSAPGKPMGDFRSMKGADAIYLLPPLHPLEVDACMQDAQESISKPLQFAIERPLSISPFTQGVWTEQEGFRVWRAHVISPDAVSIGLIFDAYHLADGVKLMVYDPVKAQVKGAYTSLNNKRSGIFAVGHIPGGEAIIELQVPVQLEYYGELSLGSLSHAFQAVAIKGMQDGRYGRSQECEIDINCTEGADWQLEKKSVVRIQNLKNNLYCTGVLLNNTSYDGDPLILTAQHCIETVEGAERSIFYFNYESSSCFGGDGSVDMSISGSESLSIGDSIDFSLVRLSIAPPENFDAYYAGWDLSDPQSGPSTTIHHPQGDVKKISSDFDAPKATTSVAYEDYLPHSFWRIKQWDMGSTEPGSSGSPLFTPDKKVIGVLSFGSAECGDSIGYDAETERVEYDLEGNVDDYYIKLDVAWDYNADSARSLKPWLDPTGSGVRFVEGLYPGSVQEGKAQVGNYFSLYPNPVGSTLWFSSRTPRQGIVTYRVYDLRGALLMEGNGELSAPLMLDVESLQGGFYLLLVEYGTEQDLLKFVKAR